MGGICSPLQLSDLSFNSVPQPPSARCAQANRRWPCLQKLRGTLIRGAETCKSIFREGFNMESLEEVLISLGIGGMTSQFAQILQSAFGSRMVPPYVAKRLNLKHVRGMLPYGPPGSGKTLIARSICKFLNAKEPLIIKGPDVLDAFQGVSERKIRSLFKAAVEDEKKFGAKSDLHIILFDEVDSIAKFLRQLSSTNSTEVLHMQQEIARLKEDTSHFQATLASYEEDKAKLENKFETIRCSVCRMGLE